MNVGGFHERGHQLLDLARPRVDERNWESAHSLLCHGEEEEFCDLLLAMILHQGVALRLGELRLLHELVAAFPIAEFDRDLYPYLANPGILDRILVADDDTSES